MTSFLVKYIPLVGMITVTHVMFQDPKLKAILNKWTHCPGLSIIPENMKGFYIYNHETTVRENLLKRVNTHGEHKPINIISEEGRK